MSLTHLREKHPAIALKQRKRAKPSTIRVAWCQHYKTRHRGSCILHSRIAYLIHAKLHCLHLQWQGQRTVRRSVWGRRPSLRQGQHCSVPQAAPGHGSSPEVTTGSATSEAAAARPALEQCLDHLKYNLPFQTVFYKWTPKADCMD